jgi:hypothetical protein
MPRRGRSRRCWAGADSYIQSVSAGSIDSRSESAHRTDESRRHGPAERERCRHGSSGFLCRRPRGTFRRLRRFAPGCRIVLTYASRSGTGCDTWNIESTSGKFGRRSDRRQGEKHFRFSRLWWMPRRGRRRRFWTCADSYFQPVYAGSIDSRSESADRTDESRRHGPAELERCRHGSIGFLCEQPREQSGRRCGTSCGNRPVETGDGKEGHPSSAFRHGGRAYFLIFNAVVDATGRADRVTPD